MRISRPLAFFLLGLTLSVFSAHCLAETQRFVAVTIDDLPAVRSGNLAEMRKVTDKVLRHIAQHRIPAIGFVNEGKLDEGGDTEKLVRVSLLQQWVNAGLDLGNHTYSHADLNPDMMTKRGYAFISLEDALSDPAYKQADNYVGPKGLSWLRRWALDRGMDTEVEPTAAEFVKELAKRR